jgi:hypothetical protein
VFSLLHPELIYAGRVVWAFHTTILLLTHVDMQLTYVTVRADKDKAISTRPSALTNEKVCVFACITHTPEHALRTLPTSWQPTSIQAQAPKSEFKVVHVCAHDRN